MTDTVRALPAYPVQVQRVNTPRTARMSVTLVEQRDADEVRALRTWWNEGGKDAANAVATLAAEQVVAREVAAAKESLLAVLQAYREEIRAEVAQEISLARAQALDMGNRIATELHGRIDRQVEALVQVDARVVNWLNEDRADAIAGAALVATPPVDSTFTPLQWILMILSLGIWRPTKVQR